MTEFTINDIFMIPSLTNQMQILLLWDHVTSLTRAGPGVFEQPPQFFRRRRRFWHTCSYIFSSHAVKVQTQVT